MCGNLVINSWTCNRESKFAAVLQYQVYVLLESVCSEIKTKSLVVSSDAYVWCLLRFFLLITWPWTTAALSECMTMGILARQDPQSSNAITMGKNSRTEMWWDNHSEENSPQNHLLSKVPPKPRLLAFVNRCKEADEWTIFDGKRAFPFRCSKNKCQVLKSARASKLSLRLW